MPGPLEKEDEEAQAAKGLWALLKFLGKHPATWPLIALLSGGSAVWGWMRPTTEPVEAFSAQEMREIVRKEVAPLRAGIEALAEAQSDRTKARVFQAMLRAERKNQEAQ